MASQIRTYRQLIAYGAVGSFGTLTHYTILFLLVEGFGSQVLPATSIGVVAGAIVNYLLNFKFTFKKQNYSHQHAAPRFLLSAVLGFFINFLVVWLGEVVIGFHYVLSQILASGAVFWTGFAINKWWTFKQS